jgi:hypothetical protein
MNMYNALCGVSKARRVERPDGEAGMPWSTPSPLHIGPQAPQTRRMERTVQARKALFLAGAGGGTPRI